MNIIFWIITGGLAGWIAGIIVGVGESMGIFLNIVIGIIGAFVGGFIADKVSIGEGAPGADRPTSVMSFVWAVVGAVVLLLVINFIF